MQSEQEKSAASSTGSSAGSRGKQDETLTSRDAGPYLARRVFACGWGLAVGGWRMVDAATALKRGTAREP